MNARHLKGLVNTLSADMHVSATRLDILTDLPATSL